MIAAISFITSQCTKRKSDACHKKIDGLRLEDINGSSLPNGTLALAVLEGPGEVSIEIATFLNELDIQATFFVKGETALEESDALREIKALRHNIGTGGFRFEPLKDAEDPVLDLHAADAAISPYTIGSQFLLYGEPESLDEASKEQLLRAGLGKYVGPIVSDTEVGAFIDDKTCWEQGIGVAACVAQYFSEAQRIGRGILHVHDSKEESLELLAELLPELQTVGFTFSRIDEVPEIRLALLANGATVDASVSDTSCQDYE